MSNALPQLVADRYRLVEPLGQGGMGRVWKARDEVLHRDVAIKELVPPPGLTEDERREMRERSLREARAIARLNHANVVRVFDVLRTDGDPWIVMEYVASRSLQDTLAADGPVPSARAAEIGLGVLGALRAAHRSGVMHRDVKPGNVLLGNDGRVVLTDFGLATVPGDPNVTRTGLVLGSPAYIAPERARDGTAGPEADLWSLGATLYAAVEGQSPFARPSAIGTLAALATEQPPPPKNAGPLKAVLNGLLRKDPTQRITADVAERLLRRAADRRSRGAMSLLDGVRRPSPNGPREPRPRLVPQPRPSRDQPAEPPVVPSAAPADLTEPATRVDVAGPTTKVPAPSSTDTAEPTSKVPMSSSTDAAEPTSKISTPNRDNEAAPTATVADPPTVLVSGPVKPAGDRADERPGAVASAPVLGPPATVASGDRKRALAAALTGRHRNWLIGALVALVLLALVVIVPLVNRDPAGNSGDKPGAGKSNPPAASPSAAPATSAPAGPAHTTEPPATPSTAPSGLAAPVVPVGWYLYQDKTGFSVPVPNGWQISHEGTITKFDEPNGGRWFLVDQTDSPRPDAVADWKTQEASRKGGYRDYQRIKIAAVDYWDYAADWEWTYTKGGPRHTVNRGFVTAKDKGYAIRWETPAADWNQNLPTFQTIADGFRPVRD